MNCSRRQFLRVSSAAVAAVAATGCEPKQEWMAEVRRWVGKPEAPRLEGPLTAPQGTEVDAVSHVLNRLTFGPRPGDYARVQAMGVPAFIEEQLAADQVEDGQCERLLRHEFDVLGEPESRLFPRKAGATDPIQELFPALRDYSSARVGELYEWKEKVLLQELGRATLLRAVLSKRQLYEVMVQFWSDHFNIDPSKGECRWLKAADDREVIRKHALGNFGELVRASALSPAMLWYLDGRVNRRATEGSKANENYARELMELHTLGVHGGYTQEDVMEVARCLTGWTVRDRKKFRKGQVEFKPRLHDDGPKTVLGQRLPAGGGPRDLDRVLGILTAHPATAQHLATKLCRRFIADDPPASAIAAVAAAFTRTKGDIRATLRALFSTPEFAVSAGQKLKRPFHFVVAALRATHARTDAGKPILEALLRMGHAPFRYPTPDGYPEEATHWMGSLLWRWNFAAALTENRLKGTRVQLARLQKAVGGEAALLATCLGRALTPAERRACAESGAPLTMALASPAFQRC